MFNSKDLLHLVFANSDDLYYGEDLLKLDLNQYLWLKLHESGYQAVYYLYADNGKGIFQIRTYGDRQSSAYEPGWSLFRTETEKFGDWMLERLEEKSNRRAALVCQLDTFCTVTGRDGWNGILQKLARMGNRTGILVLTAPAEVEKTRELLLRSSVFSYLGENTICNLRAGSLCPLYGALAAGKPSSVVYLNRYTAKRLRALLLHVMMDSENLQAGEAELDHMAQYLEQYLINAWLQRKRPLFGERVCNEYPRYAELYKSLKDRTVWRRLEDAAAEAERQGGLRAYLERLECRYCDLAARAVFPLRVANSAAGRCASLWPPQKVDRGVQGESAFQLALEIQQILLAPRNRTDNPGISEDMEKFRNQLDMALSNEDYATYRRILRAIRFCAQRLQAPRASEEEESVRGLNKSLSVMIESSEAYFKADRRLRTYSTGQGLAVHNTAAKDIVFMQYQKAKDLADAAQRRLEQIEGLVTGTILQLDLNTSAKEMTELSDRLKNSLEQVSDSPVPVDLPGGIYDHKPPEDINISDIAYEFNPTY